MVGFFVSSDAMHVPFYIALDTDGITKIIEFRENLAAFLGLVKDVRRQDGEERLIFFERDNSLFLLGTASEIESTTLRLIEFMQKTK
jgi:hypothetical protein